MIILRCTAKLLKEIGQSPSGPDDAAVDDLDAWFANLLRFERRKCVLFTNAKTRFSFFVPDLKRERLRSIGEVFAENLSARLAAEGLAMYEKKLLGEPGAVVIARTNSKSVLGSMNDLVLHIEYQVRGRGGLDYVDMKRLNSQLSRLIMGPLGCRYPIEKLKNELSAG